MNRGLYVTRQLPDLDELKMTARQICKESMRDEVALHLLINRTTLFPSMTQVELNQTLLNETKHNYSFFIKPYHLKTFQLSEQLEKVAAVYMEIYSDFTENDTKSYIGLRDFYCLVRKI
jgi:hypothetical protein